MEKKLVLKNEISEINKLATFVEELGDYAKLFSYKLFDVSSYDNWQSFHDWLVENDIKPDVLINNAGVLPRFDRLMNYTKEEIDESINIDFYSAAYSSKIMLPLLMKSETPAIVNVASSAALMALGGTSMYSASKAALKGFTEAMREEHRDNCYVGLICPGFTKTDIFRNQSKSSDKAQKAMDLISTDCDKMVDYIIKGMWKKRDKMVLGMDAHFMDKGYKILGTKCSLISSKVMKISGLDMFKSIFE